MPKRGAIEAQRLNPSPRAAATDQRRTRTDRRNCGPGARATHRPASSFNWFAPTTVVSVPGLTAIATTASKTATATATAKPAATARDRGSKIKSAPTPSPHPSGLGIKLRASPGDALSPQLGTWANLAPGRAPCGGTPDPTHKIRERSTPPRPARRNTGGPLDGPTARIQTSAPLAARAPTVFSDLACRRVHHDRGSGASRFVPRMSTFPPVRAKLTIRGRPRQPGISRPRWPAGCAAEYGPGGPDPIARR